MNGRRELTTAVVLGAGAAALVLATSTQPWAVVSATDALGAVREVSPQGQQVAPQVPALALVALAASVAVAFTRRLARIAAGIAILLAGAGSAVASFASGLNPAAGSSAALQDITGLAGTAAGASIIDASSTPWPWAAAAAGAGLCLVGGVVLLRGSRWAFPSPRYEAPAAAEHDMDDGAWAALSRGEDPTADDRMLTTKEERT